MPRSIAHPEYMFPDTTPVPDTIIVELGET